jgi:hypothetical protein
LGSAIFAAAKMSKPHDNPPPGRPIDPARWLSALPDDLPICDINVPGSHNAAAINPERPTRWACQRHSITEQLQKGIRLLDIRLKPKKRRKPRVPQPDYATSARHPPTGQPTHEADAPAYEFTTCHGHLGPFGANEFQPLSEVLEECTSFLSANPGETIIMTIQIDDWRRAPKQNHPQIIQVLKTTLTRVPLLRTPDMPTLKACRGRIFLINRINDDPALGVPINIPDNTPGTSLEPTAQRHYEVYVQDQYKKLNRRNPEAHKQRLTLEAQERKRPGALLLNFASATKPFGRFVYIMEELSQYLTGQQPKQIGWLLLDYPFGTQQQAKTNLPALIIASNYP